ncbi:MAG: PucR family transcriptional regulator [Lachnospiraceae bacterium]
MKLSMWMIVNRISELDPEIHITDNDPAILNSARNVYATNCVHVYQEEDCVVCKGEDNYIRLHDITVAQAFEIIQGVFDYYEDWMDGIMQSIRDRDYQKVIDLAWQIFRNPMVLLDSNRKVLGITRQYEPDSIDAEWEYLIRYGYSSLNAVKTMKCSDIYVDLQRHGLKDYKVADDSMIGHGGLSYSLYSGEVLCGRINVLKKDRELNPGDRQLLITLAQLLEMNLGSVLFSSTLSAGNALFNLLTGKPYAEQQLDIQLAYQQWERKDTYHLALVRIFGDMEKKLLSEELDALCGLISRNIPNAVVLKRAPCIMILTNRDLMSDAAVGSFLHTLLEKNPVHIGFSLPCSGIDQAGILYSQAASAIYYGSMDTSSRIFYCFFDYAMDYIIDSTSIEESVSACLPAVVEMWEMYQTSQDEMFGTLKCYLENNCSVSRTSAELFTHRNTILYRLKKIREFLQCDLDDPYCRDYCRISIRTLELYEKKQKSKFLQ